MKKVIELLKDFSSHLARLFNGEEENVRKGGVSDEAVEEIRGNKGAAENEKNEKLRNMFMACYLLILPHFCLFFIGKNVFYNFSQHVYVFLSIFLLFVGIFMAIKFSKKYNFFRKYYILSLLFALGSFVLGIELGCCQSPRFQTWVVKSPELLQSEDRNEKKDVYNDSVDEKICIDIVDDDDFDELGMYTYFECGSFVTNVQERVLCEVKGGVNFTSRVYRNDMKIEYDEHGTEVKRTLRKRGERGRSVEEKMYVYEGENISSIEISGDGGVREIEKYSYDDKGNLVKKLTYDEKGELISKQEYIYEYDFLGRVLKQTYIYDDEKSMISVYEYDSLGRVLKETDIYEDDEESVVSVYEYEGSDKEEEPSRETRYGLNGGFYSEINRKGRYEVELDSLGIKNFSVLGKNDEVLEEISSKTRKKYYYDEKGRVQEEKEWKDGNVFVSKYTYDKNGNWVEKRTIIKRSDENKEGVDILGTKIIYREITYK